MVCDPSDGHTYEREAIVAWLAKSRTSPMTNLPVNTDKVASNVAVLQMVNDWRELHPDYVG